MQTFYPVPYGTFYQGTAQFDNPTKAYPELTRFAKIATHIGAELELTGHTDNVGTPESNDARSCAFYFGRHIICSSYHCM
ncbi:MAG: hypothetical protein KAX50_08360 [Saprospiraceae bacterium]|nr:hypothetical protein [Saprospiraceae bacterium]